MFKNKLLAAALGLAFAVGTSAAHAQEVYVPLISKGFQHQFWQAVKAGADKAAAEFGANVTFEGPETESQVDRQMDMLAAALSRKPDAIGFAALDSQAATPLLQQAKDAGIPVIAFDSGVDSDIPLTTATTDNVAAAALAADKMAELIGGEGKVAVVAHDQTSRTGIDRVDGFVNRIKEAYPKIEVVSVQYGGGDQLQSTEITKSILLANPDLKGIFGANEPTAIGVGRALAQSGKAGKVVAIGFDGNQDLQGFVKDGTLAGIVVQGSYQMGEKGVETISKLIGKEKVEKFVDTGVVVVTKDNIEKPEAKNVLY